jgi:CRISPR-associated endonuclease/helicase Cas3
VDPQGILLRAVELSEEELDDPREKNSHANKPLIKHVEECSYLARLIADKYGLDERFSSALCALHDIGKLRPAWFLGSRVGHSREGAAILSSIKRELSEELGFSEGEMDLLIFMVKKHHSSLRADDFKDYRALSWLRERKEEACLYADAFGAFKIADFASANEMIKDIELMLERKWPSVEDLRKIIRGLDEGKWRKQLELVSESNVDLAAPTGWGKTYVGILKALRDRPMKLFYCLPTITAIRKMRERLEGMGEEVGEYFYFADVDLFRELGEGSDEERLIDFYRLFLPKINITTVDQLILTLVRAGKYHMRRLFLRDSVVVLDEYHLLPSPMIGALSKLLEYYRDIYGMRVVLMTATPLETYRKALRGPLNASSFDLTEEYRGLRRHKFSFIGRDEALNKLEELYKEGKRVLVILNTVKEAINFYRKVEGEKLLLHSRFTVRDRLEKEERIDSCRILVSTQVAEVSLDVSFDALITEIAPIPAVIQRAGRVNRYGREAVGTNVFLMEPPSSEPYTDIELKYSSNVLSEFHGELESGEGAVLRMLAEYEKLIRERAENEINYWREMFEELLEDHIYSKDIDETEVLRGLRGDPSVLVIPLEYESEVRELMSKLKQSSYLERIKIYSRIKSYLVPLSLRNKKFKSYIDSSSDLPFPLVKGLSYSEELGLHEDAA